MTKAKQTTNPSIFRTMSSSLEIVESKEPIGEGGMGVVLWAKDADLNRKMALKTLLPALAGYPHLERGLVEEAKTTALLDHPNVVPVYELGMGKENNAIVKNVPYFTMKYVQGRRLTEMLGQSICERNEQELFSLLQIFLKVCDAVAFAHSRGVIHRDIKPDNIMVGDFGEVYLMDWGLSQKHHGSASARNLENLGREKVDPLFETNEAGETCSPIGTPHYMPPEQAYGYYDKTDERSDIFALGALLYEIITGYPPHTDPQKDVFKILLKARQCDIEQPDNEYYPRLSEIAMEALAKNPQDRFQTVNALKSEIERFLRSGWQFPRMTIAKGELLVKEGELADSAYIIVKGRCQVFKTINGKRENLRILKIGDVFGETAVFAESNRTASVEAIEDVTVMQVTRQTLARDLGLGHWMSIFVKALANRFLEKEAELEGLKQKFSS